MAGERTSGALETARILASPSSRLSNGRVRKRPAEIGPGLAGGECEAPAKPFRRGDEPTHANPTGSTAVALRLHQGGRNAKCVMWT